MMGLLTEAHFLDRLPTQRQVSPRTMAAYCDGWRLLRRCASTTTGKTPRYLDGSD